MYLYCFVPANEVILDISSARHVSKGRAFNVVTQSKAETQL